MILKVLSAKVVIPSLLAGGGITSYGIIQALPIGVTEEQGIPFYFQNTNDKTTLLDCPLYDLSDSYFPNLLLLRFDEKTAELKCIKGSSDQGKNIKVKKQMQGSTYQETKSPEDGEIALLQCDSQDRDEPKLFKCTLKDKDFEIINGTERVGEETQNKLIFKIR
ncbi:hypothetical protein MHLP_00820 [Candidatus Mycoplasma haematolamae str. Purdue]|uniref:Uncharacterized protein n=1 Tax=Mycoplasma haematolamae (strain Purdue) TaxID=1212765 RepID=I7CIP2_MYCHA|nr:hypothetical protein [Candidatus Mycoplasma haematolamae]AFO51744.1 hypothetical protein MHLP_00820 [Candidatus Mycoplasma haematolamae str. Purdue]